MNNIIVGIYNCTIVRKYFIRKPAMVDKLIVITFLFLSKNLIFIPTTKE